LSDSSLPLAGCSVIVCRAEADASSLLDRLRALGADPVSVPFKHRVPPADGGRALRQALGRLDTYHWVAFTSANGVRATAEAGAEIAAGVRFEAGDLAERRAEGLSIPASTRIAVVGEATAAAVAAAGWAEDLVAPVATAAALAAAFPPVDPDQPGQRVLAPLAELASDDLCSGLVDRGYLVDRVDAYRMQPTVVSSDQRAALERADAVLLTAPSLVDSLVEGFAPAERPRTVVCIGPTTAARARHRGIEAPLVATVHNERGLVEALIDSHHPTP